MKSWHSHPPQRTNTYGFNDPALLEKILTFSIPLYYSNNEKHHVVCSAQNISMQWTLQSTDWALDFVSLYSMWEHILVLLLHLRTAHIPHSTIMVNGRLETIIESINRHHFQCTQIIQVQYFLVVLGSLLNTSVDFLRSADPCFKSRTFLLAEVLSFVLALLLTASILESLARPKPPQKPQPSHFQQSNHRVTELLCI